MSELGLQRAAGALGAFVSGVGLADVAGSDRVYAQVRDALNEHEVLFFRDQNTAPEVFAAFAKCFGEILDHPAYTKTEQSAAVQILESTPERPSKIELWHSDMTFMAQPPSYTLLQGQIIPAIGGDTLWASATVAFANLSKNIQELLAPLTAVHDFAHGFAESLAEPGGAERLAPAIAANPPVEHPLVRTHPETGARSIYVNRLFTTRIKELSALESQHLLEFLYRHVVTDEHTVRLSWAPGTVAIWDNRSTQHKPVNDFFPQHRKMHRVTLCGDKPR